MQRKTESSYEDSVAANEAELLVPIARNRQIAMLRIDVDPIGNRRLIIGVEIV